MKEEYSIVKAECFLDIKLVRFIFLFQKSSLNYCFLFLSDSHYSKVLHYLNQLFNFQQFLLLQFIDFDQELNLHSVIILLIVILLFPHQTKNHFLSLCYAFCLKGQVFIREVPLCLLQFLKYSFELLYSFLLCNNLIINNISKFNLFIGD